MGSSMWFILWCSCVLFCSWSQTACAETTSKKHSTHVGETYDFGPYKVTRKDDLRSPCCDTSSRSACCNNNLVVAVPNAEGEYPVVQFQHGTKLSGVDYEDVIDHIASWGFIVVAPLMYGGLFPPGDAIQETNDARAILRWLPTGLVPILSSWAVARPDLENIALVGHSRGGKVVYGLALNVTNSIVPIPHFSAVVGLDPVDGTGSSFPNGQIKPPVLTHVNNSLHLGVPTLIVGTGLGPKGFQPCAPENYGHKYFFDDVAPPAFHFVVPKQGHMDFCDCSGFQDWECSLCRSNVSSRPQMRSFAAGIVVAFLQDALLHNSTAFDAAYAQYNQAPVTLDPPDSKCQNIPDHTVESLQLLTSV